MDRLSQWLSQSLPHAVLLFAAGGLAMLLIELVLMHHTHGKQFAALAGCGAGLVLALGAMVMPRKASPLLLVGLIAVAGSGLLGTYFHRFGDGEKHEHKTAVEAAAGASDVRDADEAPPAKVDQDRPAKAQAADPDGDEAKAEARGDRPAMTANADPDGDRDEARAARGERGERHGRKGRRSHRPPLAPLSVSGLAFLAAVGLLSRREG